MHKQFKALILTAPLALAIIGCNGKGNSATKDAKSDNAEIEYLNQAALADESDELVADHLEEMSDVLSLGDESPEGVTMALGLSSDKESSKEKSCSVADEILTVKKESSRSKDIDKQVKRGRVERQTSRESSFERKYYAADGKKLAFECKSESGPAKIIKDKIADLAGSRIEASHSSTRESSLKLDGELRHSRSVSATGTRKIQFLSGEVSGETLLSAKSVEVSSSADITRVEKGETIEEKNQYATVKLAPLQVEIAREAKSGKLIHKLIKAGHVKIERANGRMIDIVYEQVKFTSQCKPTEGRLLVTKVDPAENKSVVLKIRFKDGEILASRDGGEEKKLENLRLRLEDCKR